MQKIKKPTKLAIVALVFSFVFSFINITLDIQPTMEAQAQEVCGGPYEVTAGQTGAITVEMRGPFAGACKPAVVSSSSGVSFDSVYQGTNWCSNGGSVTEYATQNYDATSFPGTSFPYTFTTQIEAIFDSGGECETIYGNVDITVVSNGPDFTLSCSPSTQSIVVGGATTYALSTTGVNGFNSQVNFSASVVPNVANGPSINFSNNNQFPDATTTAAVSTTGSTPANTYTITFTGTGGGQTHDCIGQLVVNPTPPPPPGFDLTITPATTDTLKGTSPTYTVSATCTGGFSGPIQNLSATSEYTNLTYTFSNSQIACGSSVTLTIGNTSAVPQGQLSTPQTRLPKTITVQGQGN